MAVLPLTQPPEVPLNQTALQAQWAQLDQAFDLYQTLLLTTRLILCFLTLATIATLILFLLLLLVASLLLRYKTKLELEFALLKQFIRLWNHRTNSQARRGPRPPRQENGYQEPAPNTRSHLVPPILKGTNKKKETTPNNLRVRVNI